jgi:hypothetical protein
VGLLTACREKSGPAPGEGPEIATAVYGYEENIHAGTHTPAGGEYLVMRQFLCHGMARGYVTVIWEKLFSRQFPEDHDLHLNRVRVHQKCTLTGASARFKTADPGSVPGSKNDGPSPTGYS